MDCSLPGYSVHGILQARILVSNFHDLIAYLFLLLNNILCWNWNSDTLATSCEELTHLKRPWCWERLRAGGEGDDRGWDGWMASPTQQTWVWVDSGSWWGLVCCGSWGRKELDTTEWLNWTELTYIKDYLQGKKNSRKSKQRNKYRKNNKLRHRFKKLEIKII